MIPFRSIVEFARFLWGDAISPAQTVALKVMYGADLDRAERALYRKYSAEATFARYTPREYSESLFLLGRQSGKSTRIGVTVTLWEALCVPRQIPRGERLACLLFAPTLRQNTFANCVEKLHSVPELAAMIETDVSSAGEVRLTNGVDILGISSNPRFARGRTAILGVVDEAAFLHTDAAFNCNLPELLESVRPSLIVRRGKLVLLSSCPVGKEGLLYDMWRNRAENPDTFVWRAPSAVMNPAIDPKLLERERKRGEAYFQREYLSEFTSALNPFLPEDAITAAVQSGVMQLEPSETDSPVLAGIDLADRRDDCALSVTAPRVINGHRKAAMLFAKAWKPGPRGHNVIAILEEMGAICKRYHVCRAKGDQKSMSAAENILGKYGVKFERTITDGQGSEVMYRTFLGLLNNGDVALLDHEELLTQLRRLEEHTRDGGRFRVAGRRGSKDDLAVSAVLAVSMCADSLTNGWTGEIPPIEFEPFNHTGPPLPLSEDPIAKLPLSNPGPDYLWH